MNVAAVSAPGVRRLLPSPGVALFAVLAALLAGDLLSVALCGRDIPLAEDWLMVPPLTGQEGDLLGWLWAQNNEHRLPLPRLLYLGLLQATGDFRVGMLVNQLLLAGLAAVLARAAWHARGGRWSYADVLFPLALLHLGHWPNLVWSWQIQFVASVFLSGLALAAVVSAPGLLAGRRAALAAVSAVLLPLTGANGLIVAVPLALWLAWEASQHLQRAEEGAAPRTGAGLVLAAALTLVLCAVYFVGYVRPPWSPPPPTALQFAESFAKFVAYGLGPGARLAWWAPVLFGLTVMAASALLIVKAVLETGPRERHRALGLAALAVGFGTVALAIAWGRGADQSHMPARYGLLSALWVVTAYYAWTLYGVGRARVLLPGVLAAALVLMLPLNLKAGAEWRDWYVGGMEKVEHDLAVGTTAERLAHDHRQFLMHWSEERLHKAIAMLRDAGLGPFAVVQRGRDR